MLRKLTAVALAVGVLGVVAAPGTTSAATGDSRADAADVYVCPMHPEVTDTRPSACPKCKMKLVKK